MASLQDRFQEAARQAEPLSSKASNEDLLNIYGLYKQATVGDVNTARPGMFDIRGKAKWDAWESRKGMSQDAAKEAYIALINELTAQY